MNKINMFFNSIWTSIVFSLWHSYPRAMEKLNSFRDNIREVKK